MFSEFCKAVGPFLHSLLPGKNAIGLGPCQTASSLSILVSCRKQAIALIILGNCRLAK
jgi:hypothetical protein